VIQACHSREGIIDGRRHGTHGHFDKLVDGAFDVLGGCTLVADAKGATKLLVESLINLNGGPNRRDGYAIPDKITRLVQQANHQVFFLGQSQQDRRIDGLDVPIAPHANRICLCFHCLKPVILSEPADVITIADFIRVLHAGNA